MSTLKKLKLSYTQIIALGFLITIAIGTLLLKLPVSSANGVSTPFIDCIFTATSATCVTGLVVYDTSLHWSTFGQAIILVMIQVGGLGLMTVITLFSIFMKKRFTLHERRLLMQSAGTMRISGVITLVKRIWLATIICETAGAILLAFSFCRTMPFLEAIWYAVFHSVSAFCNAGFDIMGKFGTPSFTAYFGNVYVNLILMFLIISGGLGFLVWNDIIKTRMHFKKLELHSKIVLCTTIILILGGGILFFITERRASFENMTVMQSWIAAFFQSVTTRTAGFNTVDQANLSQAGTVVSDILMFIGGSPGSTAGGIKTTTIAVVIISAVCTGRNDDSVEIFKRKIDDKLIKQASAIAFIYLGLVLLATILISHIESFSLTKIIFETISAIGTVGLSMGLTSGFSFASKIILMLLMFAGRIGGMTFVLAISEQRERQMLQRPTEKILLG